MLLSIKKSLIQILKTVLAITSAVFLFAKPAHALGVRTQLTQTELTVCDNKEICYRIVSPKMSQSRFKPLMAFYDSELFIKTGNKTRMYKNANGYVDFNYNVMVIRTETFEKSVFLN